MDFIMIVTELLTIFNCKYPQATKNRWEKDTVHNSNLCVFFKKISAIPNRLPTESLQLANFSNILVEAGLEEEFKFSV